MEELNDGTSKRHGFLHQYCYCEENVYKLLEKLITSPDSSEKSTYFAVFISNPDEKVVFKGQKKTNQEDIVVWDYHVIAIKKTKSNTLVYDLDSVYLSCPCELDFYLEGCLLTPQLEKKMLRKNYRKQFRIIEGKTFLNSFSSTREHMLLSKNSKTKQYQQPPPPWECIQRNKENPHRLDVLRKINCCEKKAEDNNTVFNENGKVCDFTQFLEFLQSFN